MTRLDVHSALVQRSGFMQIDDGREVWSTRCRLPRDTTPTNFWSLGLIGVLALTCLVSWTRVLLALYAAVSV